MLSLGVFGLRVSSHKVYNNGYTRMWFVYNTHYNSNFIPVSSTVNVYISMRTCMYDMYVYICEYKCIYCIKVYVFIVDELFRAMCVYI